MNDKINRSTLTNKILTGVFTLLTVLFIAIMATNENFFSWTFARHHNVLSWYIRPLFIVPFCYFAYKRNALAISITAFLCLTSMFWFPEPAVVSEQVKGFLDMEKEYLTTNWTAGKILFSLVLVPGSLSLLALAFWKRSIKAGIAIVVAIAVAKSLWSVVEGGQAGQSVIIPAAVGLVICVVLIYYVIRRQELKRKTKKSE